MGLFFSFFLGSAVTKITSWSVHHMIKNTALQFNQVDMMLFDTQRFIEIEYIAWKWNLFHFQFVLFLNTGVLNSLNPGSWLSLITFYYAAYLQKLLWVS